MADHIKHKMTDEEKKFLKTLTKPERRRFRMYLKQEGKCFYCETPLASFKVIDSAMDHVIPRVSGGSNGTANRVLSCRVCDFIKGSVASLEEAIERAERLVKIFKQLQEKGVTGKKKNTSSEGRFETGVLL